MLNMFSKEFKVNKASGVSTQSLQARIGLCSYGKLKLRSLTLYRKKAMAAFKAYPEANYQVVLTME